MSQKLITIDDHTGDTINERAEATRGAVILARNDHSLTWPNVNMTDESWDGLIKLIRDYLPEAEPTAMESGTDDLEGPTLADEQSAEADELRAARAAELIDRARAARETRELETPEARAERHQALEVKRADDEAQRAAEQALTGPTPGNMTQAQRKARSAAIRAWYYALDAQALKALQLKTPNRSVTLGKLSPAVVAAYEASH
jgi:hypothetical protein